MNRSIAAWCGLLASHHGRKTMTRRLLAALFVLAVVAPPAQAIIILRLEDEIDDPRAIDAVSRSEKVLASRQQLEGIQQKLLGLKERDIVALLGRPKEKPAKRY